jgi:ABC-type sugar transport system substrate-binding protein
MNMYLGLDLGTSGVKAMLMDENQKIIGSAHGSLDVSRPHSGWSEQDPADWIRATEEAVSGLKQAHPKELAAVRGIVAALEAAGRQRQVVYIAHELTDESRRALIDGTIDIVINQDAGHEVRSAIRVLMSRADRSPIVQAMERIRIDIYVRDNIP